jgi:ATP-dependent Clp protease ATP-binding subunit ClpA
MIDELNKILEERKVQVELTLAAKDFLAEKGYDRKFGARPLRRTIQKYIEDPLSEKLLQQHDTEEEKVIEIFMENDEIQFQEKKEQEIEH